MQIKLLAEHKMVVYTVREYNFYLYALKKG